MNKLTQNLLLVSAGTFAVLAILFRKPLAQGGKKIMEYFGFTKEQKYPILMNAALKGESKSYNDYNFKLSKGYGSYLHNITKSPSRIPKLLTQMTIGQVLDAMNKGLVFATGRYQIIPTTLKGTYQSAGLSLSSLYNEENQDKIGSKLVDMKKNLRSYLTGQVPANTANLNAAILAAAQVWSSIGVPYPIKNNRGQLKAKDTSYYSFDKASVPSAVIGKAIEEQRKAIS
jgi:muramidase (phage lysozyme)